MFLWNVLNALKTLRCENAQPCVTPCEREMTNQVALILLCNAAKTVQKLLLSQQHPLELWAQNQGNTKKNCDRMTIESLALKIELTVRMLVPTPNGTQACTFVCIQIDSTKSIVVLR